MGIRQTGIALFVSAFVIRLVAAAMLPLIPDEAYYWSWSVRPAVCYWDQPAGSAFFLGLADRWFGHSELSLRLFPIIGSLVSALLAVRILREVMQPDVALLSVALTLFAPLAFGGTLAVHDSFMVAFWTMALFAAYRLRTQPGRFRWWLLLAWFWALAVYSKLSALLFGFGIVLYIAGAGRFKDWLFNPRAWVAAVVFIALLFPVLAWNIGHSGVTLLAVRRLTLIHPARGIADSALNMLDLAGSQALLATPGLFLLILLAMVRAPVSLKRERDEFAWFLFSFCAPVFLFFAWLALKSKVQGNWPAPAYAAAFPLAIWYVHRGWHRRAVRSLAKLAIAILALETALAGLHIAHPIVGTSKDPTLQMWGWRELARRVESEAKACDASFVLVRKYQVASELMFYLDEPLPVLCANYSGRGNQFDLWNDFRSVEGLNAVVVDTSKKLQTLLMHFDSHDELEPQMLARGSIRIRTMRLICAKGFRLAGPHEIYFRDPFGYSLRRLQTLVRSGAR
ncbi:MAG TPA: glycosyltransferase family 39 protein [Proteobacteria bacterium]|nr:glycosyltransferase family 39 protein [Pseudomonadota bacterium]